MQIIKAEEISVVEKQIIELQNKIEKAEERGIIKKMRSVEPKNKFYFLRYYRYSRRFRKYKGQKKSRISSRFTFSTLKYFEIKW